MHSTSTHPAKHCTPAACSFHQTEKRCRFLPSTILAQRCNAIDRVVLARHTWADVTHLVADALEGHTSWTQVFDKQEIRRNSNVARTRNNSAHSRPPGYRMVDEGASGRGGWLGY